MLLPLMIQAGGDVLGLDWHMPLGETWMRLGVPAVQGNLDPVALLAPRETLLEKAAGVLAEADGRPGHIFNLGHGVLPDTPYDNVKALVDYVHEASVR
jgi:uroporphyrinogen decarboxylase